jgi:hypothetical protein
MHDKVVRRRRAVLALLVALSLFLLTAYFGESAGGGLHATQRGALEVLAPIQEGANKALKPARDLFGWFGDTLHAQDERDRLQKERDQLRGEVAQLQVQNRDQADRSRDQTRGGQSSGDQDLDDDNRGNTGGQERGTGRQGEKNSSGISNRGMSDSEEQADLPSRGSSSSPSSDESSSDQSER